MKNGIQKTKVLIHTIQYDNMTIQYDSTNTVTNRPTVKSQLLSVNTESIAFL